MAHPKSRISKASRGKRRTHLKMDKPTISFCQTTGEAHVRHRAFWSDGKLMYRGQVVIDNSTDVEEAAE